MNPQRIWSLALGITLAFGAILVRLGHLQIVQGEEYLQKANDRSLRLDFVRPGRGTIWGRRGSGWEALVEDLPSHDLAVVPATFDPATLLLHRLASEKEIDTSCLEDRFRAIQELARSNGSGEFILYPGLGERAARGVRRHVAKCDGARLRAREEGSERIFDIVISHRLATQVGVTLELLSRLVGIDVGKSLRQCQEWTREALAVRNAYQRRHDLMTPRPLVRDISFEEASKVEKLHQRLPGVVIVEGIGRAYPLGEVAGHLLGVLGALSRKEADELLAQGKLMDRWRNLRQIDSILERRAGAHYKDDRVGRRGLEHTFEEDLRGEVGVELVERDVRGQVVREVGHLAPRPGQDIRLTIDIDLQSVAAEALKKAVEENGSATGGAVVAVDVRTGGVLALVSYPPFDPERFGRDYNSLLSDPRTPLLNRAVHGCYAPGSIFKVVSAIGALETGLVSPGEKVHCSGAFRRGSPWFKCHGAHGSVDVRQALTRSCNVFFYEMGERLGGDRLREWGLRLGFGKITGIEVPRESRGLLPSPEWLQRVHHRNWTRGLNRNYAIGQGDVQVTPVQVATLLAAVAGDGVPPTPHLLDGGAARETRRGAHAPISRRTLEAVREGLRGVVQGSRGTAAKIEGLDRVRAAGKTGTAQAGGGRNHAWFAGYAPSDEPRIAVAVVVEKVEHGSYGGAVAGPVAAAVLERALGEGSQP